MDNPSFSEGEDLNSTIESPGHLTAAVLQQKRDNWTQFTKEVTEVRATAVDVGENNSAHYDGYNETFQHHNHSPAVINTSVIDISNSRVNSGGDHFQVQEDNIQNQNESLNFQNEGQNSDRSGMSGFINGDLIVSLLPQNTKCAWVTPASFRTEFVPEDLQVPGIDLTSEEYLQTMTVLTTDFYFRACIICYKRLFAFWLFISFASLLLILFFGMEAFFKISIALPSMSWFGVNVVTVTLCIFMKRKINKGLERCVANVNKLLLKHKLIIGVDDKGTFSCHKVHISFIYFDSNECVKQLNQMLLESTGSKKCQCQHLNVCTCNDPVVDSGTQTMIDIPAKYELSGEMLFLKYSQRWSKEFLRRRLDWTVDAGSEQSPRHLITAPCPCQYVESMHRKSTSSSS